MEWWGLQSIPNVHLPHTYNHCSFELTREPVRLREHILHREMTIVPINRTIAVNHRTLIAVSDAGGGICGGDASVLSGSPRVSETQVG